MLLRTAPRKEVVPEAEEYCRRVTNHLRTGGPVRQFPNFSGLNDAARSCLLEV